MDVAELVKDYFAVFISWPLAAVILVIVFVLLFQNDIRKLLARIGSIEGPGGIKIRLQEHVSLVREQEQSLEAEAIDYLIRPHKASLERALSTLYSRLKFDPDHDVRCTAYVPWPMGPDQLLVQGCSYIPQNGDDKTGRLLSARAGAIGKCSLTKEPVFVVIPAEQFQRAHVRDWQFTETEAGTMQQDRRSYMCQPVLDASNMVGVIFFDSKSDTTFTEELTPLVSRNAQHVAEELSALRKDLEILR